MRIIFLHGGRLSCLPDRGPIEAGEEIAVPDADGLQLIESGAALPVPPPSAKPLTFTMKVKESGHV